MKKLLVLALASSLLVPAATVAETYKCSLKAYTRYGWIPPDLFLFWSDDRSSALVYDYFVHEAYGKPLPVDVSRVGANRYKFTWTVREMAVSNSVSTIGGAFIARLDVVTKKMTLQVFLNGGDIHNRGGGTCAAEG